MGKNLAEYLREANRLLKKDGQLIIAEIRSRFTSVPTFIMALKVSCNVVDGQLNVAHLL